MNLEKFIAGLHDYLARALQPLAKRIDELENEVKILRAAKSLDERLTGPKSR